MEKSLLSSYLEKLELNGLSGDGISRALTHRSYCAEHEGVESNERLEFLGDSILGAVVGIHVYAKYLHFEEGQLTKLRASVVSTQTLAKVAKSIGLGEILLLGRGEEASGGREKSSLLADAFEALVGQIYLELGFSAAEKFILGLLEPEIVENAKLPGDFDYKSRLQELLAQLSMDSPRYELSWSGPDHSRSFEAVVRSGDESLGVGTGSSKKMAEQNAARKGLYLLQELNKDVLGEVDN